MFQPNREYLNEYFITIGVDSIVKLLKNGNIEVDANDLPYFEPCPEPFDYNYYFEPLVAYFTQRPIRKQ
jgi:hypothetical protein